MSQPAACPTCRSADPAYPKLLGSLAGSRLCTDPWHPRVQLARSPAPASRIPGDDETITRGELEQRRKLPPKIQAAIDDLMACTDEQLREALLFLEYQKPGSRAKLREFLLGGARDGG